MDEHHPVEPHLSGPTADPATGAERADAGTTSGDNPGVTDTPRQKGPSPALRYGLSALLGVWSSTALSVQVSVAEGPSAVAGLINGFGLEWAFLSIAIGLLAHRVLFSRRLPFSTTALVLSIMFAASSILGSSYFQMNSWDFIFANRYQLALSFCIYVGYVGLFYLLTRELLDWFDKWSRRQDSSPRDSTMVAAVTTTARIDALFQKQPITSSMAVILLAWLPVLVAFYPGSVGHDGLTELNMYFGIEELTNYHPVLSTWLMGIFMTLGRSLGSDNLGVFTYVLAQSILFAYAFGYMIRAMLRLRVPHWLPWATLAFAALFPLWPAYAQAEIKDTAFTAFYILFAALMVEILAASSREGSRLSLASAAALVVTAVLVSLTRNNGIYVVAPSILAMIVFISRPSRRALIGVLGVVVLTYGLFTSVLLPALEIPKGSIKETLSIPFQQTARFMVEHPEDVTTSQREAIDAILPVDSLAERYNPQISDPVKNLFRKNSTNTDLRNYFVAWTEMLFTHPDTYIQATLNNVYGYFYFGNQIQVLGNLQYYQKGAPVATGFFSYDYLEALRTPREAIKDYSQFTWDLPGIGLLYASGFYTWVVTFLGAVLIRRRRWVSLAILVPALLSIAVCVASPVNGLVRYMLPVMATLPLLLAWALHEVKTSSTGHATDTPAV